MARKYDSHAGVDRRYGLFTWSDPHQIALSLKQSAEASHRRKAPARQSAMSLLNFYISRAGKKLPPRQKHILEQAKDELKSVMA